MLFTLVDSVNCTGVYFPPKQSKTKSLTLQSVKILKSYLWDFRPSLLYQSVMMTSYSSAY